MKITFNINFYTIWGQSLFITGSIPELGSWNIQEAKPMQYDEDGNWSYELELYDTPVKFEYRYFLKSNDKLAFEEWNKNHAVEITDIHKSYYLYDYWQNRPSDVAYYSSAFIKSLFAHPCNKFERVVKSDKKLLVKVLAPQISKMQSLAICGNQEVLGNWNVEKALILSCDNFPQWSVELDTIGFQSPVEYKFLIVNDSDRSLVRWEQGENRILNIPPLKDKEVGVISGLRFKDKPSEYKCAGLSIPVFALRSTQSFGIGDFSDLKRMLTWAAKTSQKMVQILPVNDTTMSHTWEDSYPYNAISIYALHPLYLSLPDMGTLKDPLKAEFYAKKQQELNQLEELDYEQVDKLKWSFFKDIFDQEGKETILSEEYLRFFEKNKEWLIPYAAYSYLRDKYKTSDFSYWGDYSRYNFEYINELTNPENEWYDQIAIYYYLQYHLDKQLAEVRNYAHQNGIVLKGDIPIGVSSTSIEAWTEPQYFNMQIHTGAPPDDFSTTGQNWGFPTYNWPEMEKDNYSWWKKRFRKMSDYFDAYRIDHILGFFRIWGIPEEYVQGLCGVFNPALPLSEKEIEDTGLPFKKEYFTTPDINESYLREIFGEHTSEVTDVYLQRVTAHYFGLKEKFNTQRKIETYFSDRTDAVSIRIRDGLYNILNEILFIPDEEEMNKFHPRISAFNSYKYKDLSNSDRYAFDHIYWHYFYQRHNNFWKEQGYKRLTPLVNCTDMLVCGEDLGMIPQSVPEVMQKLQILSLEIERMPKEANVEFANLQKLPYLSVCTTSTHDMSTIRGWWREDKDKMQRYYNHVLHRWGQAPEDCFPEICEQIIMNNLWSPSMLVILPLQDWLSIDEKVRRPDVDAERINIPSTPRYYWKYRMHLNIEDLVSNDTLNEKIKKMIGIVGR